VCLSKAIKELHATVLADKKLGPVFSKLDMEGLTKDQTHFMELAFTGDAEEECTLMHN
jgi:truncated hemoglobin YjbI